MKKLLIATAIMWSLGRPAAADDLTWKLWHQLHTRPGNMVFSPMSIEQALGMVALGARGATLKTLADVPPLQQQMQAASAISKSLAAQDETLKVANGLWLQTGLHLLPTFTAALRAVGAEIATLDFRHHLEEARTVINHYVSDHTHGHIPDLVTSLDPRTDLFVANAVYFKGAWNTAFNPQQTVTQTFTTADGHQVQAPTMHLKASTMQYTASGTVQVLAMPYRDQRLEMMIVLPGASQSLTAVEDSLDAQQLETWSKALRPIELEQIAIPRFTMKWSGELQSVLAAAGKESLFDGTADLTGMVGTPQKVSAVYHAATITVNEVGTEATAATGIGMRPLVMMRRPSFIADHAFVFCIRDTTSGAILFMGRVDDPTAIR